MHLLNLFYDSVSGGGIDLESCNPQTYFVTAEKKSGILLLNHRKVQSHRVHNKSLIY